MRRVCDPILFRIEWVMNDRYFSIAVGTNCNFTGDLPDIEPREVSCGSISHTRCIPDLLYLFVE